VNPPKSRVQPPYEIFPEEAGNRFRVKIKDPSYSRITSPVNFTEPTMGLCGINGNSVPVPLNDVSDEAQAVIRCICGEFHGSKVTVSGGTLICHVAEGQVLKAAHRVAVELRKITTRHSVATA